MTQAEILDEQAFLSEHKIKKLETEIFNIQRRIDCERRILANTAAEIIKRSGVCGENGDIPELRQEYLKKGLGSDKVRRAVAAARNLFFDDQRTLFRETVCLGLHFSHSINSGRRMAEHVFMHVPSKQTFFVRGILYDSPDTVSCFQLSCLVSRFYSKIIVSSHNSALVRQACLNLSVDGFKIKLEESIENIREYPQLASVQQILQGKPLGALGALLS